MDRQIVNRVYKSYTHRNYESAIFQLLFVNLKDRDLFVGIFYYDLGNFAKAISLLKKFNTHTSKFYLGLCYKKQRNYTKAIESFLDLIKNGTTQDELLGNEFDNFFITDFEYVHELLGECYTVNKERNTAIEHFTCSFQISPLIKSFENLVAENVFIKYRKTIKAEDEYFQDIIEFEKNPSEQLLKKYKKHVPGYGSSFLSHCGKTFALRSRFSESILIFEFLRKRDQHYIKNLDYYSTLLWFSENSVRLASLAKELQSNHISSHIFWIVIGNFFSNRHDNKRAVVCFSRSNFIEPNHNAQCLLGHEALLRGEYKKAMKYFINSQELFKNNYNAIFAIGMVYESSGRFENAEIYYKKGFSINPHNSTLKTVLLQFYVKIKEYEKAMQLMGTIFGIEDADPSNICNRIEETKLNDGDEKMVLIFIEVLLYYKLVQSAAKIFKLLRIRSSEYYTKKNMIDEIKMC